MKTIPVEQRDAARKVLAEIRPYLSSIDYREIAAEMTEAGHDVTAGTVAQTAKGARFNVEVVDALTKRASANKAKLASLLDDMTSDEIKPDNPAKLLLKSGSGAKNRPGADDAPDKTSGKRVRGKQDAAAS